MEPWKQTLSENPDIAALMDEDATFTLRLSDEERSEWETFAAQSGETIEQTIHRVMRRAVQERLDYEQSRREFS